MQGLQFWPILSSFGIVTFRATFLWNLGYFLVKSSGHTEGIAQPCFAHWNSSMVELKISNRNIRVRISPWARCSWPSGCSRWCWRTACRRPSTPPSCCDACLIRNCNKIHNFKWHFARQRCSVFMTPSGSHHHQVAMLVPDDKLDCFG